MSTSVLITVLRERDIHAISYLPHARRHAAIEIFICHNLLVLVTLIRKILLLHVIRVYWRHAWNPWIVAVRREMHVLPHSCHHGVVIVRIWK